jgi:hypothetical protein
MPRKSPETQIDQDDPPLDESVDTLVFQLLCPALNSRDVKRIVDGEEQIVKEGACYYHGSPLVLDGDLFLRGPGCGINDESGFRHCVVTLPTLVAHTQPEILHVVTSDNRLVTFEQSVFKGDAYDFSLPKKKNGENDGGEDEEQIENLDL